MELLSSVIYLDTKGNTDIPPASGPLVQGWFFKALQSINKDLADDVHKNGGYSLSGIMQDENGSYIHIASLRSDLSEALFASLLPELKEKTISLDAAVFGIKMLLTGAHALAGHTNYAELRAQTRPNNTLTVTFTSPTAFRTNGMDLPLPLPYHVLLSWWKAWNKFAPEKDRIGYPLHLFAENCVTINTLQDIKTMDAHLPKGNRATGFTGQATFALQPLGKSEEWQNLWKEARRDWQTLANFALYAGTGQHTGCGMGQTQTATAPSNKSAAG